MTTDATVTETAAPAAEQEPKAKVIPPAAVTPAALRSREEEMAKLRDAAKHLGVDKLKDGSWFRRIVQGHVKKHFQAIDSAHWRSVSASVPSRSKSTARSMSSPSQGTIPHGVRERLRHALHPLIALAGADRKRQMARAQPRMAEALDVQLRSAEPADEEPVQLVARAVERRRMQRAHFGRVGARVHEVVEAVDEATHAFVTADARIELAAIEHVRASI